MELRQKSFSELLAFGEEGEHEVAQMLINRGVTVLPLYQFQKEHAPFLIGCRGRVTSPDLICFRKDAFMVEVKTKNQWVDWAGELETGFNMEHFTHYKVIKELTGKEVFIFFNHKTQEPTGIYYTEIDSYTRKWDGNYKGVAKYKPMVFYNKEVLSKIE